MILRSLLGILSLLLIASAAYAQRPPMKWGDIPDEHLALRDYSADPQAQAVVLGDYGSAVVNRDWSVTFERHRRIKILEEGGYELANVAVVYSAEDGFQRIKKIKGQTFIPEPGGGMRRVKLDKKSIFKEDLEGGRERVKFTLPALEPGAVVEFSYVMETESPLVLPRWYFQDEEPVLYSEFRLEYPQTLAYTTVTQGAPLFTERTEEKGARPEGHVRVHRWVVEDVPAFREEQYMTTFEDYIQKLDFQLVEYYRQGIGVVRVIKTWEQLAEELEDNLNFGRKLRGSRALRREVEAVVGNVASPGDKARALYDHVRNAVAWDGAYRTFADKDLDHVLRDKRGSSAEINLLLVTLLREAGLPAAPALLSTRSNGKILRTYPLVSQFNYVVAAVKQGGRWHLLDATERLRPYGLMPVAALNEAALVVADTPEWVPIQPGLSEHAIHVEATLDGTGALIGSMRSQKQGYAGITARKYVQDHGAEGYAADELLSDLPGVEVEGVSLSGEEETDKPFVVEVAFRVPDYAQAVGDLLLVNPIVLLRSDENPFTLERRTYPVDFAYPFTSSYTAEIAMPSGYAIDEIPRDALSLLPLRGGGYERSVVAEEGILRVSAQMKLQKPYFNANLYSDVKGFFDRVVSADAETVVLKRAESAEASPAETEVEPSETDEDSDGTEG